MDSNTLTVDLGGYRFTYHADTLAVVVTRARDDVPVPIDAGKVDRAMGREELRSWGAAWVMGSSQWAEDPRADVRERERERKKKAKWRARARRADVDAGPVN